MHPFPNDDDKSKGCDPNKEFDCDDGTCIHESLKCDGQVNCKYRYDEASDPGPCLGKLSRPTVDDCPRAALSRLDARRPAAVGGGGGAEC